MVSSSPRLDSVHPSFPGQFSNATKSKGAAEMVQGCVPLRVSPAGSASTRSGQDRCEKNTRTSVDFATNSKVSGKKIKQPLRDGQPGELYGVGEWCERRDLNPHGCPPDPKSGASAIPPLSHPNDGSYSGKHSIYVYFRVARKNPPSPIPGRECPPQRGNKG